ncbi:hypothetical protein CALVIDRAFT_535879 [Calocera viscosa TUFC12733]|uniref:Alpha/beta-hydrolase n=1 Tax=Calocera viscosa (strain TUFC12733) TaxID=1330018 RepID=A0A167NJE5_CALVF|nr:hypothetical protein CALVIDRAFT_535879 [Calocera viscosa TUFC12733]
MPLRLLSAQRALLTSRLRLNLSPASARLRLPFSTSPLARDTVRMWEPSRSAQREVPTPLVLVSAREWDARSAEGIDTLSAYYSTGGYTCLSVDLSPPAPALASSALTGQSLLSHYTHSLSSHLRLLAIPWPPILISRSLGCLIAQAYIEDYPAKGLILLQPPPRPGALPGEEVEEFTYEPRFPILILDTAEGMERQREENRLLKLNLGVSTLQVERVDGQEALVGMERWLDEIGV